MTIKPLFIKKIIYWINDRTMKTKLLISFLLFSGILIFGVGLSIYNSSSEIIDSQSMAFTESIVKQVRDRVDEIRDEVLKVSIPIVINPSIQNNDLQSLEMADYITRKYLIKSDLNLIMFMKKYICSIYLCNENGTIITSELVSTNDEKNFNNYIVYRTAMEQSSKPVWVGTHENEFLLDKNRNVFSFVRSLYDKETLKNFGVIVMNVPTTVLDDICGASPAYNIFITDKEGKNVYQKQGSDLAITQERTYIKEIAKSGNDSGTLTWESNGDTYGVRYITSEKNDWIFIAEVPVSYLLQNSEKVRDFMLLILLIGILMSIATSYLISSYFTTPLRRMIKTMKKVQSGDFDIKLNINNRSETGQLAENYVIMVNEIRELIEGIKQKNIEKREAEIQTLQAQITPHFIYNALNSIRCMARVQKTKGIEDAAEALIGLLQLSISKKTVFITIAEEIEIVKKYVQIQNFRSGNKFDMKYDFEENILGFMTLKFILQPLVENAILHGLEPKGGSGTIKITAYMNGSDIQFEVEDNGMGMDEEKIEKVLSGSFISDRRFSGIGIKNINDRIKMHFGQEYGISFDSVQGEYSKAIVKIPAIEEKDVGNYV